MKCKEISTSLYKIKDVLSISDFTLINDEFNFSYNNLFVKNNSIDSSDILPRLAISKPYHYKNINITYNDDLLGDNLTFIRIGSNIKLMSEKILKRKLSLVRINTNIQYPGMENTFHQDGIEGCWTFVIFLNTNWDSLWGGEFVYTTEGEYYYVPFIPNCGCLCAAHRDHRGSAPNSLAKAYRKTIAFTMYELP
jgi:hypothetical protein